MKKEILLPNDIWKYTLDEFATVTLRVDTFASIHYKLDDDGSLILIIEPQNF